MFSFYWIGTVVEGGYKGRDIEPSVLWISKIWILYCLSVSMYWTLPRYIIFKSIAISKFIDRQQTWRNILTVIIYSNQKVRPPTGASFQLLRRAGGLRPPGREPFVCLAMDVHRSYYSERVSLDLPPGLVCLILHQFDHSRQHQLAGELN